MLAEVPQAGRSAFSGSLSAQRNVIALFILKKKLFPNQEVYSRLKGYLWAFVFMGQEANILDRPVRYQPLTMLSD